jgi:TIR domain
MAGGIFISYRRDDTRQAAGRLADDLADHFGSRHIFRDIEGIELGVDFAQALNQALEACVVMLVLIGPKWLEVRDAQGRRRLDDPRDWIRQEIVTALKRGIRVVPLLIDGTPLPAEDQLPEDLQPLVRRQALEIADTRWRGDLQRLAETLARVPGLSLASPAPAPTPLPVPPPGPAPSSGGRKQLWIGMAIGVVGILVVAANVSQNSGGEEVPPLRLSEPTPAPAPSAAPTPVAAPAPAPPPQAPALPNLAGLWRTLDGETYQFQQQGRQVNFVAQAAGINVGGGQGELDGSVLRLSMSLVLNGVPLGMAQCNLQASPDFQRFVGMCQGANGPFQAQMFR